MKLSPCEHESQLAAREAALDHLQGVDAYLCASVRVAGMEVRRAVIVPHQLRHAHAVEMAREGVPLNVIQRQLGHANLRVTSIYLQGIDSAEIINAVHARRAPMMPASAGLHL